MIWSRSTSDGRYDWYATSKKTVQMPTRKPTTKSCAERQRVGDVRDRDRREERRAAEVARDEDRPARQPVDPDARRQA